MREAHVENMRSSRGNKIANQFIVTLVRESGVETYFQSYDTVIVRIWTDPTSAKTYIRLDKNMWDYSTTTSRYRNQFLGETKKGTQAKIDSGEYTLADLN